MTVPVSRAKLALFELRSEWQARVDPQLDAEYVDRLREALEERAELPPVAVVVLESGALALVDGYHRYAAHLAAQRPTLAYHIVGRGEKCVEWHLAQANSTNGRERTHADKRAAVKRAVLAPEGAETPSATIARWCRVSVDLVRSVRSEVRGAPSPAAERQQVIRGEREPAASVPVPRETARDAAAREPLADRGSPTIRQPETLPAPAEDSEPEWRAVARAQAAAAEDIVRLRHRHSALLHEYGRDAMEHLGSAHAALTRRLLTECTRCRGMGCVFCADKGFTVGAL